MQLEFTVKNVIASLESMKQYISISSISTYNEMKQKFCKY